MYKILFDLKKEYYLNSLKPVYDELARDPDYQLYLNIGKDQRRFWGIFLLSEKNKIAKKLEQQGYKLTDETRNFDAVICGDALKNPERYGETLRFHLDHGVGIKTLRIRNLMRQPQYHYHVFLEGQYWYDYIKSIGAENVADFYLTGIPKLDPLVSEGYYDNAALAAQISLDRGKKTVLFAPSYKPSCIKYVQEKITELLPEYNVVIKLHPYSWQGKYAPHSQHKFYEKLARKEQNVYLIDQDDFDIYPYLALADTLISDTSSVINEFLAMGKHGIIYVLPHEKLKHSDGMNVLSINPKEWLQGAFPHMQQPDDLLPAVKSALNPTPEMQQKLQSYRDYFFTGLDGNSALRVKKKIDEIIKERK
ncbi:MAG: CDP-glycerol glycerophosphotransferase family protein [Candidatus Cloacimonadales bacterium]